MLINIFVQSANYSFRMACQIDSPCDYKALARTTDRNLFGLNTKYKRYMERKQLTPLSYATVKWMQFVLMMPDHWFCLMYKRDSTLQEFNKISCMTWNSILKMDLPSRSKFRSFNLFASNYVSSWNREKYLMRASELMLNK